MAQPSPSGRRVNATVLPKVSVQQDSVADFDNR
jgi:hypothetical protein